jgi:hypothetical protein
MPERRKGCRNHTLRNGSGQHFVFTTSFLGLAFLHRAASVTLFGMYGSVSEAISIDLANAILFTAFAVAWTGARVFDGREVQPVYLFGGRSFA